MSDLLEIPRLPIPGLPVVTAPAVTCPSGCRGLRAFTPGDGDRGMAWFPVDAVENRTVDVAVIGRRLGEVGARQVGVCESCTPAAHDSVGELLEGTVAAGRCAMPASRSGPWRR